MLLDGALFRFGDAFAVVGIVTGLSVVVGRVAPVTEVDIPIAVGEEFIVVVVDPSIAVFCPFLFLGVYISRPIVASAILALDRTSLSIITDDAFVLDYGERS